MTRSPWITKNNRLLVLANTATRKPNWLGAIVLSIVFLFVAQISGGLPAFLFLSNLPKPSSALTSGLQQAFVLIFSFAPIFLVLWIWLRSYEHRPLWTLGLERDHAVTKYLRGMITAFVMFAIATGLMAAFGAITLNTTPSPFVGLPALGGVLLVYLGWTVQGPAEEALTRGWLMPVIGARYRPWVGILISSAVFAIYHSFNPNVQPLAFLNLFLFGVFIALYALADSSIWGVFGWHAVWNWAEGNIFGFQVSGLNATSGTLVKVETHGQELLTGGLFGPEGGLAVTAVLIFSILIVWWIGQKRKPVIESASPAL